MAKNEDFYKEIVDNLPEGVAICDSEQNIVNANKNFQKLSGFTKEELIGKNIQEILNHSKETCDGCSKQDEENQPYQIGELRDKNEKLTCVRINSSKAHDNNTIHLIIPFSDIAFLNQAHIDFVSTVSHELRTPLTSIKGFADTLLNAGDSLNKEQQTRFVKIIKNQIDRLTRLVENLLTVSKLEAKKSKNIYRAIEVKKTIETVLYNLQHKLNEHNIKINLSQNLPPVWADADKLEQVMTNLVDNAIKYSKPGTTVGIEAKFVKDKADKIEFKISDEGVGIPEEFLSKIFTKFSRIDNPLTREIQGTGLGLYITKTLVDSMKGTILAESNGNGAVFTVMLPAASPETPAQQKFQEVE